MNSAVIYANGRYVLIEPFIAIKMKWKIHFSGKVEKCVEFLERKNKALQIKKD